MLFITSRLVVYVNAVVFVIKLNDDNSLVLIVRLLFLDLVNLFLFD